MGWAAALLGLLTACSGSEGGEEHTPITYSEQAVSFATQVSDLSATRGGTVDNVEALKELSEGFGVLAYLTETESWATAGDAATPDFMYNQQVRWGALYTTTDDIVNDWVYSPLKYWPNSTDNAQSRYISFFAYAPFVEIANSTTGSTGKTTGITGLTYASDKSPHLIYQMDATAGMVQTDVLWAQPCLNATRNGNGLIYFEGTTEMWQKVPLEFHHALAAVEVYVQRIYDEPTYSGKKPDNEEHTKLFVSQLDFKTTNTVTTGLFTSGRLNLETGVWTSLTGSEAWTAEEKTLTYGEGGFNDIVRGTASDELGAVRQYELNKWGEGYNSETGLWDSDADYGVDEVERLLFTDKAITLLPSGDEITISPTLQYSMITRDDELLLSTLTDKDGHKYARIVNQVTGNPLKLKIEAGKKYKLVIRIGVEHVEFEVVSVVDWDFPMRFNPGVGTGFENEEIDHTLNEE